MVMNRREIGTLFAVGTAACLTGNLAHAASSRNDEPAKAPNKIRYCLNTSTIRGQNIGLEKEVELVAKAGYDGIEPWIREIEQFVKDGGDLNDLRKKISDLGLTVESAIGFANWIVDDDEKRKQGLEQAKRDMDLVAKIGGGRIAAPPVGATDISGFDLFKAAERYAALVRVGKEMGVLPQLELWGFSKTLSRLGELAFVAVEANQVDVCVLPDIYHIYKGGSGFDGLSMFSGARIHCFHVNDYPATPGRAEINDSHRVYPGDGVAPIAAIYDQLKAIGFQGALSLELFNPEYWKRPVEEVLRVGLEKMQAAFPT